MNNLSQPLEVQRNETLPPVLAARCLRLILAERDQDPILGDLAEQMADLIGQGQSPRQARSWCWHHILRCVVPFLWIRLGRIHSNIPPPLRILKGLTEATLSYYLAVVLFFLVSQLPHQAASVLTHSASPIGISFQKGFLVLSPGCAQSASQITYLLCQSWQETLTAVIVIVVSMCILRCSRGWPGVIAGYVIIAGSSGCLMPLLISRLTLPDGWWLDYRLNQPLTAILRCPIALLVGLFVIAAVYYTFDKLLFLACRNSPARCLQQFLFQFLVPVLLVVAVMGSSYVRHWNSWLFEYRTLTLLPIFVVGAIAALRLALTRPPLRASAAV